MKNKLLLQGFYLALLIALGFLANYLFNKPKNNTLDLDDNVMHVQVIKPKVQNMNLEFKTVASLRAKNEITLTSGLKGAIEKILLPSGSKVKQGDNLLKLKPDAYIRAPFQGVLSKWQVKPSEFIEPGKELVKIVDNSILEADYYVPEHYAGKLNLGQKVVITTRAYDNLTFDGTVTYVSPIVDEKRHSILVEVEIDNKNGKLMPGLFTRLTHILDNNPNAITVPEPCIVKTLDTKSVFKIVDNVTEKVEITTYRSKPGIIEITSGINPDDMIVLTIPPGLTSGRKVATKIYEAE